MPNPGWNVYWSSELTGTASNLFATTGWNPWRTDTSAVYLTPSPLSEGKCRMYLENPPSGYSQVAAGGYTDNVPIDPSLFNGEGLYRNRWTAVMDFYPTERPVPHANYDNAHAGVFLRVQPNRTWDGHPDQTRFGCYINGLDQADQGVLQFTSDDADDPNMKAQELFPFDLSEDPFANPTQKYRVQIIEEEWLSPLSGWTLQWGSEVWNRTSNTKIGERKWITENTLETRNVVVPDLSGSRFAMGLGPSPTGNADGTVNVDFVGTSYWHF